MGLTCKETFWNYGRILYPDKGHDSPSIWIFHKPSYSQVRFVHLPVFKINLKNRKQILNSKQLKKTCHRKFENKEVEGEKEKGNYLVSEIQ